MQTTLLRSMGKGPKEVGYRLANLNLNAIRRILNALLEPTPSRTPGRGLKARLDRSDWEWDREEDLGRRPGPKGRGA
jgi:hypothetical protein